MLLVSKANQLFGFSETGLKVKTLHCSLIREIFSILDSSFFQAIGISFLCFYFYFAFPIFFWSYAGLHWF